MPDDLLRELCIHRPLVLDVTVDDDPYDLSSLTGDEILLTARRLGDGFILVDHVTCEFVTDGSDGSIQRQFTADELAAGTEGTYELQLELIWPGDKPENVQVLNRFTVQEHWGTHPT